MAKSITTAHPLVVSGAIFAAMVLGLAVLFVWPLPIAVGMAVLGGSLEVVLVGWLLALGLHFNSEVPSEICIGSRLPKAAFALAVAYWFVSFLFFDPGSSPSVRLLLLPFHLLAMAANFYLLWFASRSLKSRELGHAASFYEAAAPFILVWLLSIPIPIGPYIVQRKARTLAARASAA